MEDDNNNKKPYKIKDVTRNIKKALVASNLQELKTKSAEKFDRIDDIPNIHLDSDGTEIDDEDYFQTLEPNAELIAVFAGEQWMDPTHYVTITTRRDSTDTTDCAVDVERVHLKKIVGQLKNNLCNVSVLSDPDLELLSNMDPNSYSDITGKDFMEQLKEVSGRILFEKREAFDAIELLKLFAKHQNINLIESTPHHHLHHHHHSQPIDDGDDDEADSGAIVDQTNTDNKPNTVDTNNSSSSSPSSSSPLSSSNAISEKL